MNKKFLFAMALPLVFTACSQEELVNEAPNQGIKAEGISGLALNIAKESGSEFESRATMGSDNVLTFEKDDNVSLYWLGNEKDASLNGLSNAVYYTEDGGSFQSKSVVYEGYNLLTYPADLAHVSAKKIDVKLAQYQNPANYIKNWVYVGDSALQVHMPVELDTNNDGTKDSWGDPLYKTVYGSLSDYATAEEVVASNVSGYNKGLSTGMKPLQTDLHLTLRLKNVPAGATNVVINKVELVSASKLFSTEGYLTAGNKATAETVRPNKGSKADYLNPWYVSSKNIEAVGVDCSNIAVVDGKISFHMLLNPVDVNLLKVTQSETGVPTYALDDAADQPVLKVYTNYGVVTIGGSDGDVNNQTRVIYGKNGTTAAAETDNKALLEMIGVTNRKGFTKVGTNTYRQKNKGWYVPRVVDVDLNNADIQNMHVKNNTELNAVLNAAKNLPTPPASLTVYLDGANGKFTLTDLSVLNSYTGLTLKSCTETGKNVTKVVVNTTAETVLPNLNVAGATIEIPATSAISSLKANANSPITHSMTIVNKKTTGLTVGAGAIATINNAGAVLNLNGGTVKLVSNYNGVVNLNNVSSVIGQYPQASTNPALTQEQNYGTIKYTATTYSNMQTAMTKGANEVTIENINLGFFSQKIDAIDKDVYQANKLGLDIKLIFNNCGDLKDLQGGLEANTVVLKGGTKASSFTTASGTISVTNWVLYDTTVLGKTIATENLKSATRDAVTSVKIMNGANATINGIKANSIIAYAGSTTNITASASAPAKLAAEGTVSYAATGSTGTITWNSVTSTWGVSTTANTLQVLVVTGSLKTNQDLVSSTVYIGENTYIEKTGTGTDGVAASGTVVATKFAQIAGTANFISKAANQQIWSGETSAWEMVF